MYCAVQRLTSLDESNDDEAAAVHHVLSIFENMVEVKPEVAELAVEKTKVMSSSCIMLSVLINCIGRASNSDDCLGVHEHVQHTVSLAVIQERAAEAIPRLQTCFAVQLLKWILGKVKQRGGEVDSNKQYTSELLAILMQHSEKNQTRLGEMNGIDTILQAIAYYKNRCAGCASFLHDTQKPAVQQLPTLAHPAICRALKGRKSLSNVAYVQGSQNV